VLTALSVADLRDSDHVEDTGVKVKTMFKRMLKKSIVTAWLDLSGSEWGKWRAVVSATMNLRVHCCIRYLDWVRRRQYWKDSATWSYLVGGFVGFYKTL
jgi:hypothetical protein